MINFTATKALRLKAAVLLGAIFSFASLPATAEDDLLEEPLGEVILKEQKVPEVTVPKSDPEADRKISEIDAVRKDKNRDLSAIDEAITISSSKQAQLEKEIASIVKERDVLVQELIDTAETVQKTEKELIKIEGRLESLLRSEEDVKLSLSKRRKILIEVLAALQRMGRNPPPTWVVAPQDALQAVRSAVLVGAVVPEVRSETDALIQDLKNLNTIKVSLTEEYENFAFQTAKLKEDQVRIDLLVKEKKKVEAQSDQRLRQEKAQAEALAKRAGSLRELIAGMEAEIDKIAADSSREILAASLAAKRRAEAVSKKIEKERNSIIALVKPINVEDANSDGLEKDNAASTETENGQIIARPGQNFDLSKVSSKGNTQSLKFTSQRGKLPAPVSGVLLAKFGERAPDSRIAKGRVYATRASAKVTAPVSGEVRFAGNFRSYGQLIILDVGENYHVLLSGMDTIDVNIGAQVKKGEPIATMGEIKPLKVASLVGAPIARSSNSGENGRTQAIVTQNKTGTRQPMLYVELRRNNETIDSTGWWKES